MCGRVDSWNKGHHTLSHPPSNNSSDDPHSHQNYHHATDSHNIETSKPANEVEATIIHKLEKVTTFFKSYQ